MAYPVFASSGDPIIWATIVGPNGGDLSVPDGTDEFTVEWMCFCDRPDATVWEVLGSTKLPRPGEVLKRYRPTSTGGLQAGTHPTYVAFGTISSTMSVANYSARQDENEPHLWRVSVIYNGVEDPTTIPAEVSSESSEYQTSEWIDVMHRPVENSAYDPILGGMPVQRNQRFIRITRSLPWAVWDMDKGAEFENTLNQSPFTLSRQVRDGNPVVMPVGTVRIKRITEQEVVYRNHPAAADRRSYWRTTVELHVDRRTITLADGTVVPLRHRWATADAGYRQLNAGGQQVPIYQAGVPANEMQLLNGRGKVLHGVEPLTPSELVSPGDVYSVPDYYVTYKNRPLTVWLPGVLANDEEGSQVDSYEQPNYGTVVLDPDGGFVYTPPTDFHGWATFTYVATKDGLESNTTSVHIRVRNDDGPVWLFFEPYKYADWSPLAALLANW